MAEFVYIATSPQYPGMVKIGRTDRSVDERMRELSAEDYGVVGDDTNVAWEASNVLVVEDNVAAESALHQHFAEKRLSEERELFLLDDPEAVANEAASVVEGRLVGDLTDPDVVVEVMERLVELGLVIGAGALLGRAVHRRLVGNPKYDAALREAARYSLSAKAEMSRVIGQLESQWDSSEPMRSELAAAATDAGQKALEEGKLAVANARDFLRFKLKGFDPK